MTTLTITPNWKNKTARFKGTIAAGEHVAVRIVNDDGEGDEYITDTTNLRLRVVNPMNGKTLAQFPMPEVLPTVALEDEEETEGTEATEEDAETWGSLTPLTCELNLNTDRMLMAVPPAANVPLLFVLDAYEGATDEDEGEFTLYFKDMCEVTHWPRRRGEEEPTNLDDYKDIIADFREDIYGEGGFKERVENAEDAAIRARDAATESQTSAAKSAIAAGNSASSAQTSAATAKNWATGGGATGDPGATNNAKYFAQQAGASATGAATSATSAATAAANAEAWAVGKRNGVDVPSTDATYENNAKHYAAAAAASAQEAEETLENKADKATTLAGYGIADAYTKTEADGKISTAVSAEATARNTAIANAINAVKDSAPEAFDTLKEIADWIGDDQSGAAAMAAAIANKVDKVPGKGLSTNDYDATEKGKVATALQPADIDPTLSIEGAAADAKATGDAVTLTPVYSDTQKFSRWTIFRNGTDVTSQINFPPYWDDNDDAWYVNDSYISDDHTYDAFVLSPEDSVSITWQGKSDSAMVQYVATRVRTDIIGYQLGSQATKPLQPQGDYAPATNIPKSALASGVQTSLGLADTAVQPSALADKLDSTSAAEAFSTLPGRQYTVGDYCTYNGKLYICRIPTTGGTWDSNHWDEVKLPKMPLIVTPGHLASFGPDTALTDSGIAEEDVALKVEIPYSLGTPSVINAASSEVVEGEAVTYGEATLADRTANIVQVTAATALDELRLTFPAAVSGKVRDFGLRVEVGDGTAALTAPALVPPSGVTLENADGEIPALADGTVDAKGVTLLYFSETAPGVFLVKGEQVKEA